MATTTRKGGTKVGGVSYPAAGKAAGQKKGSAKVGSTKSAPVASSSPMGGFGVTLGTTKGNHNVAHPIRGGKK